MSGTKVLLIDPAQDGVLEWARASIHGSLADAEITVRTCGSPLELWRTLKQARPAGYEHSVLPFRQRFLASPRYWAQVLLLLACSRGSPRFASTDGLLRTRWEVARVILPLQPLMSLLLLLRLPLFLARELIGKFALARENPAEPFVGYGAGKGAGGLVYWLNLSRKATRYGQYGIAHDSYWGMPISIHSWPLAILGLRTLGFRLYVVLSALLLAIALIWAGADADRRWTLALLPMVFASTYFVFNIYSGTWELLAWGLGALALVASAQGQPIAAGVFLAGSLLTHPGASALVLLSLCAGAVVTGLPFVELVITGSVVALLGACFMIPYWRCRHKLGRGESINAALGGANAWKPFNLYRLVVYGAFCVVVAIEGARPLEVALIALPFVLHYVNTRLRLIFSNYTMTNYMMVVGGLWLVAHQTPFTAAAYLLTIFTGPWLVTSRPAGIRWEFDLTPVRLDDTARRVRELFARTGPGRVGFESTIYADERVATLTYILVDQPVELMNTSYTEIGDATLYHRFCRHFRAETEAAHLEQVCRESGTRYLVAFSPEFERVLVERGYPRIGILEDVPLAHTPGQPGTRLALFELPCPFVLVDHDVTPVVARGEVRFPAQKGRSYHVKLTAFPGWRAFLGDRAIASRDARPGIFVEAPSDGELVLRYRYRHYWTRAPRAEASGGA